MCGSTSNSTFTPAAVPASAPAPVTFGPLVLNPFTRDGYNVASAMRGPDFTDKTYADSLKEVTTAVLRYFIGAKKFINGGGPAANRDAMGVVNTPAEALAKFDKWDAETQKEVLNLYVTNWHFSDHFSSGIDSVERLLASEPEKLNIVRQFRSDLRARGFRYV